VLSVDAIFVN